MAAECSLELEPIGQEGFHALGKVAGHEVLSLLPHLGKDDSAIHDSAEYERFLEGLVGVSRSGASAGRAAE